MSVTATMLHDVRLRKLLHLIALILALYVLDDPAFAQVRAEAGIPKLSYEPVPNFFQLPAGENFVECCGVAVNSKGHIYVFPSRQASVNGIRFFWKVYPQHCR